MPSYKYYLVNILYILCPKKCHKNFENGFTNKGLMSKNNFEYGFLHGEIESKGSHYFPRKKFKYFI